ncbi:cellobiose dehydrogenase [Penicillium canariense]|uniref:Cellobiose dehydrogenase n=1 Tax=Penicillium canariense TaxID=189055 RepID=A0A9W9LGD3_9EURO|nr:cellobiose dehydrogenase [Penicillium canariense]KAJ5153503.1 cellobiose dehydrogenase [Penicillium canariense]
MQITYLFFWFSLWITLTIAQLQTFAPPGQNEITYAVNIPQQTAASGEGPIYFQLKSTRELQWFAWGQGSRMQGANIFVIYASADGNNITVSPRLGVEHVEPLHNPQARVSILEGSGISNGIITANIRCDSCITWPGGHEDITSSSSPWVWAFKNGQPLDTDSLSATITMHDNSGIASLNLQKATGGTSENPFLISSGTTTSSGQSIFYDNSPSVHKKRIAHAVIMITVFVILFPSFALALHIFPSSTTVWVHAFLQLFTLALAIAGLGIGISMARDLHLIQTYHPIIGMVVVPSLILFQPAMGLLQHRYFGRTGKRGLFGYLHQWFGRSMIILGIINGGLGFRLTGIGLSIAPTGAVIAYSVVAGVFGIGYCLTILVLPLYIRRKEFRRQSS